MDDRVLHDLFSLEGKVVLVTGASSGIGRELAVTLAQAGARVALGGRSVERLTATRETIMAQGGEAESFPSDLGELDAAQALVHGGVDAPIVSGLRSLLQCRKNYWATSAPLY